MRKLLIVLVLLAALSVDARGSRSQKGGASSMSSSASDALNWDIDAIMNNPTPILIALVAIAMGLLFMIMFNSGPRKTLADDEHCYSILIKSMSVLQQTQETNGAEEKRILNFLQSIDPNTCTFSIKTRVLCAQWLISFHMIRGLSSEASNRMADDMQTAWEFLNCDKGDEQQERDKDLLRLDIALRLQDKQRLGPTYDRLIESIDSMSQEELMVTFTIAPILGRWKDTRILGDRVAAARKGKGGLEYIHKAALARSDLLDYEVLHKIAAQEEKHGDIPLDTLKWKLYKFKSLQTAFKDVQCQNKLVAKNLRRNMLQDGRWRSIPVMQRRLVRTGGVAQVLSLSAARFPLVGPADNSRIRVLGYIDLDSGSGGKIRQIETLELSKQPDTQRGGLGQRRTSKWVGTYSLTQEHLPPSKNKKGDSKESKKEEEKESKKNKKEKDDDKPEEVSQTPPVYILLTIVLTLEEIAL